MALPPFTQASFSSSDVEEDEHEEGEYKETEEYKEEYLKFISKNPSIKLSSPSPKLLVLDLNGTLVYRKKSQRSKITRVVLRPYISEFIKYVLFSGNFLVMTWSSARPENVDLMVEEAFGDFRKHLLAVWGRDTFGMTEQEYLSKTETIKDLRKVWDKLNNNNHGNSKGYFKFDQTNTIIIDDSSIKTKLQPFNAIVVKNFDNKLSNLGNDMELRNIIKYLETLKCQSNISSYIKSTPYNSQ
ncbi:1767_t:CDS:2 [Entrophospora sp. SA101]|nr:18778_t:CDS:2 [Entrophospora sp. SA101]CAJ0763817.1 1767_t:CDS:2 [Entrophospora sp. SA101]